MTEFICEFCDTNFVTEKDLELHTKKFEKCVFASNSGKFDKTECDFCGEKIINTNIQRHLKICTDRDTKESLAKRVNELENIVFKMSVEDTKLREELELFRTSVYHHMVELHKVVIDIEKKMDLQNKICSSIIRPFSNSELFIKERFVPEQYPNNKTLKEDLEDPKEIDSESETENNLKINVIEKEKSSNKIEEDIVNYINKKYNKKLLSEHKEGLLKLLFKMKDLEPDYTSTRVFIEKLEEGILDKEYLSKLIPKIYERGFDIISKEYHPTERKQMSNDAFFLKEMHHLTKSIIKEFARKHSKR